MATSQIKKELSRLDKKEQRNLNKDEPYLKEELKKQLEDILKHGELL